MKTPLDPRHKTRQKIVKLLFAESFLKQLKLHEGSLNTLSERKIKSILNNLTAIDATIKNIAPTLPVEKINKIDLAILRLAVYEILIEKNAPPKVIVDEAVELAKEFGGDTSPSFINGSLGRLFHNNKHENSKI